MALQYCQRHRDRHEVVWWVIRQQPAAVEAGLAD